MVDSPLQESKAADRPGWFQYRLSDLFIGIAVLSLSFGVAKEWNIGLGVLAGLLFVSALRLVRRRTETRTSTKVLYRCIACTAILGSICSLARWPIGLFVLEDVHYYFHDKGALRVDDISIHAVIEGERSFFCIPPIIYGLYEGPPYKAGLVVVDYDNKNKCEKVEITSLVLTCAGKKYTMIQEDNPIESPFATYLDRGKSVASDCLCEVSWLPKDNDSPIVMDIEFIIHKSSGTIESQIHAVLSPSHDSRLGLTGVP